MHEAIGKQEELKPCPFCGNPDPEIRKWHDFDRETYESNGMKYFVQCIEMDCWSSTYRAHHSQPEAIAAWNRRTALGKNRDHPLIQELEKECSELRRQVAELDRKNIELLNDASMWRNRAINAEEELAGTNRL